MSRTSAAVRAFKDFKGEAPTKLRRARLPDKPVVGWQMGPMVGVAYEARRDGKVSQYFHEFKKSARPNLIAQDDGRQLYIQGGRYRVTDRGIEDMPPLMIVNPLPRSGRSKPSKKGNAMARRNPRRRRSSVNIYTANPRRRRRAAARRRAPARRSFARNPLPRRRRRRSASRIYRANPRRRARASVRRTRRFRRNPSGGGVGRLSALVMPAIFIGLGGVAAEWVTGVLPIPIAWKTGPARYLVKAGVGIVIGLVIAKVGKQKKFGYYFAAGAIAIATHDWVKSMIAASNMPGAKGLGYTNPGSMVRFGQYTRPVRMGQYTGALTPVRGGGGFGGDAPLSNARTPGGEMNFAA